MRPQRIVRTQAGPVDAGHQQIGTPAHVCHHEILDLQHQHLRPGPIAHALAHFTYAELETLAPGCVRVLTFDAGIEVQPFRARGRKREPIVRRDLGDDR